MDFCHPIAILIPKFLVNLREVFDKFFLAFSSPGFSLIRRTALRFRLPTISYPCRLSTLFLSPEPPQQQPHATTKDSSSPLILAFSSWFDGDAESSTKFNGGCPCPCPCPHTPCPHTPCPHTPCPNTPYPFSFPPPTHHLTTTQQQQGPYEATTDTRPPHSPLLFYGQP